MRNQRRCSWLLFFWLSTILACSRAHGGTGYTWGAYRSWHSNLVHQKPVLHLPVRQRHWLQSMSAHLVNAEFAPRTSFATEVGSEPVLVACELSSLFTGWRTAGGGPGLNSERHRQHSFRLAPPPRPRWPFQLECRCGSWWQRITKPRARLQRSRSRLALRGSYHSRGAELGTGGCSRYQCRTT